MRRADVLKLVFVLMLIVIGGCVEAPTKVQAQTQECERLGLKAEPVYNNYGMVVWIQCVPK